MRIALLIATTLGLINCANAQECNPKDFTFQDMEKVNFSNIVKYSGYSVLQQSKSQKDDTNFAGSAVIYDVPVSLSYSDSKAMSEYLLKKSGFSFDQDTRYSFVRTALSSVGADMYSKCLATQSINVTVPRTAYSEKRFNLTVKWVPQTITPENGDYEIRVIGGLVDGKATITGKKLRKGASQNFQIDKFQDVLQINILVYGMAYPAIIVPPTLPVKKVKLLKRYGTFSPPRNGGGNTCSDHAYLVSEVGSSAGGDTKDCRLCVDQSQGGLLLKGTAVVEGQLIDAATKALEKTDNPLEICANFESVGRGKNGPRTEVRDGRLYVWEATTE